MVDSLEFGPIQADVVNGLKKGNEALKQLHSILSIDQIESILEETQEGIEKQRVKIHLFTLVQVLIINFVISFFSRKLKVS